MKKRKSAARSSTRKVRGAPATIDEYLAKIPEPGRTTLSKLRAAIRSALPPEATETISYGIPAFRLKQVLVWFAAFSDHCSFFPTAAVIADFKSQLKAYVLAKGTIQFPLNKPFPAALAKKITKVRLAKLRGKPRR